MNSKKNKVCAVVVTYNRLALLKECIEGIKKQTFSCDLLVIDNFSQDGTESFLKNSGINYYRTESNIGGAGGFNIGMKLSASDSYGYIWLMDDDCVPEKDALEKLMIKSDELKGDYGFLASKVLWIDGSENKMNKINYFKKDKIAENLFSIKQATFVSILFNIETIRRYGLPVKDFFIWGDDIEYTRRIAVLNNCPSYYVDNSVVVHKTRNNNGSKIAFDSFSSLERYRFAYRNEFYLYRKEGLKGITYYICKCIYNGLRIILYSKDNKLIRLRILLSGIKEGAAFNPAIEYLTAN